MTTALDQAYADLQAAGEEDVHARLRWFDRLSASELFLLLEAEAVADRVRPRVFEVEGGAFVCVFDREERLSAFAGEAAPYAALSGRALTEMLVGRELGLAVNLGTEAEMLLDGAAVAWLSDLLAERPSEVEEVPQEVEAPRGLPETLLTALDARLATAAGLAGTAVLVAVRYAGGGRGHLLAVLDAVPGAEPALARLVGEALSFSGLEAGTLDVGFFRGGDALAERLLRVGLRFDLPEAVEDVMSGPGAPGLDPDKPPRLR